MNSNVIFLILCVFALGACTSAEQEQLETLEAEVIAVHDEIMPEMGRLSALKTALQERNQEIISRGDTLAQEQVIVNDLVITNLDVAHEEMMAWMRQFERIDLENDVQENQAYLEQQMQLINEVKTSMSQAIQSAEEALKQ